MVFDSGRETLAPPDQQKPPAPAVLPFREDTREYSLATPPSDHFLVLEAAYTLLIVEMEGLWRRKANIF